MDLMQLGIQSLHDEEVRRQRRKLEADQFLSDPINTNRIISHIARTIAPEKKLAKIGANAPMEKVLEAIPDDDPRGPLLAKTMNEAGDYVKANPHLHPKEAILKLYNENLDANKTEVFKAMQRGYSSFGNLARRAVGIKPTDEYAPIAGYDEWKKQDDLNQPDKSSYTNPLLSMALVGIPKMLGLGAEKMVAKGATGLAVRTAAKYLGGGLLKAPHPMAKVAGAALMAIPEFFAFDVASNVVKNSEWARNRSDLAVIGAEGILGLGAGFGTAKGAKLLDKFARAKGLWGKAAADVATKPTAENILGLGAANKELQSGESLLNKWRGEFHAYGPEDIANGLATPPSSSASQFANSVEQIAAMTGKSTEEAIGLAKGADLFADSSAYKKSMQVARTINDSEKFNLFMELTGRGGAKSGAGKAVSTHNIPGVVERNLVTAEEVAENRRLKALNDAAIVRATAAEKAVKFFEPLMSDVKASSSLLKDPARLQAAKDDPIAALRLVDDAFAESRTNNMGARLQKMSETDKQNLGQLRIDFMMHDPESKNILQSGIQRGVGEYEGKLARDIVKIEKTETIEHIPYSFNGPPDARQLYRNEVFGKNIEKFSKPIGKDLPQTEQFRPMMEAVEAIEAGDFTNPAIKAAREMGIHLPVTEAEKVAMKKIAERLKPVEFAELTDDVRQTVKGIMEGKASINDIEKGLLEVDTEAGSKIWDEFLNRARSGNYDGGKKGGKLLSLALITSGTIPLASLLGTSDAEAGVLDTAGRTVSKYTAEMLRAASQNTGRKMEDVAKEMLDKGYVVLPPKPGQTTLNPLQKQIIVTPDVGNIVMENAKNPLGWKRYFTKGFQADWLYGTFDKTTGRLNMSSPMIQLAHAFQSAETNSKYAEEVVANILKGVPSHAKEVETALKPLYERYYDISPKLGAYKTNIDNLKGLISKTEKVIGKRNLDAKSREALQMKLDSYRSSLAENEGAYRGLIPEFEKVKGEYEPIIRDLAQRYPGVRINLAARGKGLDPKDAWLEPLLTTEERVAAGHIRKFLDDLVPYIEGAGERPLLREPFVPFGTPTSVNWEAQAAKAGNIQMFGKDAFPLAHLNSRMMYGLDMLPDIQYTMKKYIPDVMKRIQLADFWREGQKGGWAEHAHKVRQMGLRGAEEFWQGVKDSLRPHMNTPVNKMVRQLYAFESMIRLAVSPAVALKHAVKMESTWATAGFGHAMEVMPKTMKSYYNNVASDISHAITGKRNNIPLIDSAADALSNQNRITALISDMNLYEPPATWWERFMDKMSSKGSVLVANTERFDRFHATIAAMDMAAKQGMTAEQATYGVMDMIMRNNFLSGNFNPAWLQNPKTRLMMMFQGTPFKILEQRMLLAMRSKKSFSEAAGKTWELLQGLKSDVKEGEAILKSGLIRDALATEKDVFGNPYTHQMMRKAMILGTMMLGGRALFEADLGGHVMHIPGVKFEGGAQLSLNPFLNAALQTKPQDDEYWLSAFFKKWLPAGPIPMMLHKANRLSEDDIPKIYRDNKLAYLFSIPLIKEDK